MERIELAPDEQTYIRLDVVVAELSWRRKSDGFNSLRMHLFFEGQRNKEFANMFLKVWHA